MKDRTIERNRALDFLALDQFWDERGKSWHLERIRNALDRGENENLPDRDLTAPNQKSDRHRRPDLDVLRREKNLPLIESIGRAASDHRQRQHRQPSAKVHQSEHESG